MKDITHKPESLRTAVATGKLYAPTGALELLKTRQTEKGDALEVSRMAGIMAAKNTPQILPFCHPVMTRAAEVRYDFHDKYLRIEAEVSVINSTGVEMEALTAVSATALCLYDMLKPHVKQTNMQITDIHLLNKVGGKSQYLRKPEVAIKTAVIVTSDAIKNGSKTDRASDELLALMEEAGFIIERSVISSDKTAVMASIESAIEAGNECVITVGGTGMDAYDQTVNAVADLLDKPLPGLIESARVHGQRRTPYASLSDGAAGLVGKTVVVTLPGSRNGAVDGFHALRASLLHIVKLQRAPR